MLSSSKSYENMISNTKICCGSRSSTTCTKIEAVIFTSKYDNVGENAGKMHVNGRLGKTSKEH
jgi:hypothetical protein